MSDEQLPNLGGAGGKAKEAGGRVPGGGGPQSLAAVMELEVPVSIELGRTHMSVEDVLELGRGSVVQLDRLVGQPVEVYVSDKPFATGEVVVMGEQFGVRILRIREPSSRADSGA